jgi:tol-pal system protein YbgF
MRSKLLMAGLLAILGAGLAYPQNRDILQLQKDMIDMQVRMKQLQTTVDQNDAILKALVEKMADQVNNLSSGMQKVTQAVDGVRAANEKSATDVRGTLVNMNSLIGDLQKDLSAARSQINSLSKQMTTMQTTAEPLAQPDDLWRSAYVDFAAGNFSLAVSGYEEFLAKYPNDLRAADAHQFIGDAFFNQKKYDQAILSYDIVLQKYPDSDKTGAALLKKGLAYAELGQPQQATDTLNEVVKKFPKTSEASNAAAKLKELRSAQKTPARRP